MPEAKFHACMIAGTHSGAGKTTVMFALEALARQKGLVVQPFKGGPDYIDPGFHNSASGRKCRNLDLFLLSPEAVKQSFLRNSQDANLALVEGMMGLFDGKDESKDSSAALAKLLGIPVILVVDGAGLAGSAAAIVLGFQMMDPTLKLAGVIFNRVNSEKHFQYLKRAVENKTGVPCLGFLPKEKNIGIPERHLGLTTVVESESVTEKISQAASLLQEHLDWNKFLEISSSNIAENAGLKAVTSSNASSLKIAVARDEAFSFYYEDNFDLLEEAGAKLSFFSPIKDSQLPEADLLYFGGGFPELYAAQLSENTAMLSQIRKFYQDGGWIYAECGGLMYLSEAFRDDSGREFPLAGLVPGKTHMTKRLQNFGYHEIQASAGHFLFSEGTQTRSHEFHHSLWDGEGKHPHAYVIGERREGFSAPRLIASYQHLHFGSTPGLAGSFIQHIMKERNLVC